MSLLKLKLNNQNLDTGASMVPDEYYKDYRYSVRLVKDIV